MTGQTATEAYRPMHMHPGSNRRRNGNRHGKDAIALLKADYRHVGRLFSQFEKARARFRKETIARQICDALLVHTTLVEEVFTPAFYEATGYRRLHQEAAVAYVGAKKLIAELEQTSASDAYYDARVRVLHEIIRHYVKQQERPGGMFAEAREADMDLVALGERLLARKVHLEAGGRQTSRVPA